MGEQDNGHDNDSGGESVCNALLERPLKAQGLFFEKRYGDDSGTEFGIWLKGSEVEFEFHGEHASIPVEQLSWLRGALARIAQELSDN
jgi:hypothetical protein